MLLFFVFVFWSNITSMWTDIKYWLISRKIPLYSQRRVLPKNLWPLWPPPPLAIPTRHKRIHRQVYLCAVLLGQLDALCNGGEAGFTLKHLATEDADKAYQLLLGPDHKGCNRNVDAVQIHCCFKYTETVWTIRDGKPRLWLILGFYIIRLKHEWTLQLILGLYIIRLNLNHAVVGFWPLYYQVEIWVDTVVNSWPLYYQVQTHIHTHMHTLTHIHFPPPLCLNLSNLASLSLCPTWITPIVVRECLEELLGSVWEAAKEDCAQTANVQSGGPFKLQLPDVVADDGTAVLQKQLACLKQTT